MRSESFVRVGSRKSLGSIDETLDAILKNNHIGLVPLLLLSGDVEVNPGPNSEYDMVLLTQNCRGLNNNAKLQFMMREKAKIVKNKRYILALQETYLIDDTSLKWYGNFAFYYEKVGRLIDELEVKYLFNEPELILMGDFNLPLELDLVVNVSEKARAKDLSEFFSSLGLIDCWKDNDNRITQRSGQNRLDRIFYRIAGKFCETLETDWTFTNSDHCLVMLKLKKEQIQTKQASRRLTALPVYVLNNKIDVDYIRTGLTEFQSMLCEHWSASLKLVLKLGTRKRGKK